jgi:hypothetical protein
VLITQVDAAASPVLLAAAWWGARRVFGPPGPGRLARSARAGGYLALCALVLVKALVERFAYSAWHGAPWLGGLWVGEVIFLAALAVYVAGLTRVTARRPAASPALAVGIVAGVVAALILLALPPWGDPLHVPDARLLNDLGRGVAIPLVLIGGIVAGRIAARRATGRGSRLPLADVRARQGLAAGLCAGAVAALILAVAGDGAAALLPHVAVHFPPLALPNARHVPPSVVAFETSVAESAGGYLLPLVFFPVLGAGLGAWGGLSLAGHPASGGNGGGGGGGGPGDPAEPPPPSGGRTLDEELDEVLQAAALDAGAASVS